MLEFLTRETHTRLLKNEWLFLIGLVIFTVGQGLTGLPLKFSVSQEPIDYMHWMMLLGALMMIPFAVTMPRTIINRIASPLLVLGVAAIVGMAVIDFILWSYGTSPDRFALVEHLQSEPVIWGPFITIGPGWIFGFGLCLPCLYYLPKVPVGALLVVVGGVMLPMGFRHYVLLGYPVIILGYAWCFFRHQTKN